LASEECGVVLFWTAHWINFALQQSPGLGTTDRRDVPATPALDYSTLRNHVAVSEPTGPMFYRLISR
jgi:hypothetical protein